MHYTHLFSPPGIIFTWFFPVIFINSHINRFCSSVIISLPHRFMPVLKRADQLLLLRDGYNIRHDSSKQPTCGRDLINSSSCHFHITAVTTSILVTAGQHSPILQDCSKPISCGIDLINSSQCRPLAYCQHRCPSHPRSPKSQLSRL